VIIFSTWLWQTPFPAQLHTNVKQYKAFTSCSPQCHGSEQIHREVNSYELKKKGKAKDLTGRIISVTKLILSRPKKQKNVVG